MFTDFIGFFKIVSANNNLLGKEVSVHINTDNERVFVIHNFAFGMNANCTPLIFGNFVKEYGIKLEKVV